MSISVDNDTMQVDENYNGPDKLMHHTLALFPILKAALFMNNCVAFQTEKYIWHMKDIFPKLEPKSEKIEKRPSDQSLQFWNRFLCWTTDEKEKNKERPAF